MKMLRALQTNIVQIKSSYFLFIKKIVQFVYKLFKVWDDKLYISDVKHDKFINFPSKCDSCFYFPEEKMCDFGHTSLMRKVQILRNRFLKYINCGKLQGRHLVQIKQQIIKSYFSNKLINLKNFTLGIPSQFF